jgi:hypothetical protein
MTEQASASVWDAPSGRGDRRALVVRTARLIALLLLALAALFWTWVTLRGGGPPGGDIDRMWLGALRVRAGEPIYANIGDERLFYTWAPWLAWVWVPLTYLPKAAVSVVWMALCTIGWVVSLWPARRSVGLMLLAAPLTLFGAWSGNIQPIMTAWLVLGMGRGWNPIGIGIAASLKVSPILLVLPWVANREWRKVIIALTVALVLGAPAFLTGIDHYPFGMGPLLSLRGISVPLWILMTTGLVFAALVPSNRRFRWVTSATAAIVSRPSLLLYDIGYLLVGLAGELRTRDLAVTHRGTRMSGSSDMTPAHA